MSLKAEKRKASVLDVDALLQDSYLLVVEFREGVKTNEGRELWQHCCDQVERVRQKLQEAGMGQRNVERISYAQCALLDETVLGATEDQTHASWAGEPLQAKYFNRHQAGIALYEDMREALREPAPDVQVLTVYQRVLMLGFKGRYQAAQEPEREQLLRALDAQVSTLALKQGLVTVAGRAGGLHWRRWIGAPLVQVCVFALLIAGIWWGLNHVLGSAVSSLLPAGRA